jgi:hypothetical protein
MTSNIKRYLEYQLRWQFSGVFMMVPMYYIKDMGLQLWLNIMIVQLLGACVFWKLDKWIFSHKIEEVTYGSKST